MSCLQNEADPGSLALKQSENDPFVPRVPAGLLTAYIYELETLYDKWKALLILSRSLQISYSRFAYDYNLFRFLQNFL